VKNSNQVELIISGAETPALTRRKFVKGAATIAAIAATIPLQPIFREKETTVEAAPAGNSANSNAADRANDCFNYRKNMALANKTNIGPQADNGDSIRFTDFSCSYSKGLPHDYLGIPNAAAMASLKNAFATGQSSDFANIIVGTPGGGPNSKLNGPQVALAFDLEGMDSHSTVIPPAPSVASAQTAAEAVEHYWDSLLADVPFTEYATNPLVGHAVADMNTMSFLSSAANKQFPYPVTRQNLFRGQFVPGDGNVRGPYISQFMIQPTFFGSQELSQRHKVFLPVGGGGSNYLSSVSEYQLVQNGGDSGLAVAFESNSAIFAKRSRPCVLHARGRVVSGILRRVSVARRTWRGAESRKSLQRIVDAEGFRDAGRTRCSGNDC
jgi:hypothetical protein